MNRSNLSVGNLLVYLAAAALLGPAVSKAQSGVELGADAPKLILAGGMEDDLTAKKEADSARQTKVSVEEKKRLKSGQDMAAPSAGGARASSAGASAGASKGLDQSDQAPKNAMLEASLQAVPLNEGVDLTTEALDEGFFKDIARQESLTYQELFETSGSLRDETESVAEIIDGEPSNQITFSREDIVYINKGSANGITAGMRFSILKVGAEKIYHPITGVSLGRLVSLEGIIEILESNVKLSKAKVIRSYNPLERGDLVIPYEKPLLPSMDPDKPVADKEVEGYVVRAKEPKAGMARGDIIFVDVGAEKGVAPGDIFNVLDTRTVVRNDGRIVEGIPKLIGKLKVISTTERTATAIVTASVMAIYAGDKIELTPN